jgi:hypothetical protein
MGPDPRGEQLQKLFNALAAQLANNPSIETLEEIRLLANRVLEEE